MNALPKGLYQRAETLCEILGAKVPVALRNLKAKHDRAAANHQRFQREYESALNRLEALKRNQSGTDALAALDALRDNGDGSELDLGPDPRNEAEVEIAQLRRYRDAWRAVEQGSLRDLQAEAISPQSMKIVAKAWDRLQTEPDPSMTIGEYEALHGTDGLLRELVRGFLLADARDSGATKGERDRIRKAVADLDMEELPTVDAIRRRIRHEAVNAPEAIREREAREREEARREQNRESVRRAGEARRQLVGAE